MTRLVGTHELPCISDTDYAAYALYMQCLAEHVESELIANSSVADQSLHQPIAVWRSVTNVNQGGSASGISGTLLYSYNWNPTFGTATIATLNRQGWWLVGGIVDAISSAPVVGNNRIAALNVYPPGLAPSLYNFVDGEPFAIASLQDTAWETNTGGGEILFIATNVYASADINAGPDDKGMHYQIGYSVENTGAETVTFTATWWAAFLGDTPLIQA